MTERSYLVAFEELFEFLVRHRLCDNLSHIPSINRLTQLKKHELNSNEYHEFIERFRGTWWHVTFPVNKRLTPQCAYVADSLTDALRLKPDIALSPWSCCFETQDDHFTSKESWEEEFEPANFWLLD